MNRRRSSAGSSASMGKGGPCPLRWTLQIGEPQCCHMAGHAPACPGWVLPQPFVASRASLRRPACLSSRSSPPDGFSVRTQSRRDRVSRWRNRRPCVSMIDDLSEAGDGIRHHDRRPRRARQGASNVEGAETGRKQDRGPLCSRVNVGGPGLRCHGRVLPERDVLGQRRTQHAGPRISLAGPRRSGPARCFGTHGGQRAWLYSAVDEIVDLFLREYRIANKSRLVSE